MTDWPIVADSIARSLGAGRILFNEQTAKHFITKLYINGIDCTKLEGLAKGTCSHTAIRSMLSTNGTYKSRRNEYEQRPATSQSL